MIAKKDSDEGAVSVEFALTAVVAAVILAAILSLGDASVLSGWLAKTKRVLLVSVDSLKDIGEIKDELVVR